MNTYLKQLFARPIIRFAAVGAVSTTVDIVVLKLLSGHILLAFAVAFAFLCGLSVGFFLNSRYVFSVEGNVTRYGKYTLVSLGGLFITEVIIHALLQEGITNSELIAKLFAVAVVFFWNYCWSRAWAFR